MNIEALLHAEIQDEIEGLNDLELGSKEYAETVNGLTKLIEKAIEIEKLNLENDRQNENREFENNFKIRQLEEDKKDRLIKNGIAVGGIVLPLGVTIWGALKSWKFEETGTVTTMMGRGFINKLLPKK